MNFLKAFRQQMLVNLTHRWCSIMNEVNVETAAKVTKPKYDGRIKKRQWEDANESDESKKARTEPRVKRRKSIILMGYSGINYYGMQRNPEMKTIEEDLLTALLKAKLITDEAFAQVQTIQFQRAARTDKGVSAARQVVSLKLPDEAEPSAINEHLPEDIRVFAVKRVTKGFNSKSQCDARTYTYTLPTVAFANHDEVYDSSNYRINNNKMEQVRKILKYYEGSKNFHNFTSRKDFYDPSSRRFIVSCTCLEPFISRNMEFAVISIKGQSFMLHQIRKMVGLALAIIRGHTTEETLEKAWTESRLDIPMAPGLGLVLDRVHYDKYNTRYGLDGIHEILTWEKEEEEIKQFTHKYIYEKIIETEVNEKCIVSWLETLPLHSYDVRDEGAEQSLKNLRDLREKFSTTT
ncbi:tRNA pseudouridine synthase A-like [Ctenocephalides felis]|uniref:tRNA pseudouridine synthase A-like n=1 Tax=Ctenocephalides felis TaxID=7515 RepID=UPI000E6E2815|nr:tRNA pseudouridine synthase A-like [Ctenocephalides felis]